MTTKLIIVAWFLATSQASFINAEGLHVSSRKISGENAYPGEFPHQVSIQIGLPPLVNYTHFCAGSIISEKWILTAVHCTRAIEQFPNIIVIAGKHYLNSTESSEQASCVESYSLYKNPDNLEVGSNDIALIKLGAPFHFNSHVASISLPQKGSKPTGTVWISGWGSRSYHPEEPITPTILQKAKFEIVDSVDRANGLAEVGEKEGQQLDENSVNKTNICSGPITQGLSLCNRDFGGPLIRKNKNGNTEIVGVASWGMSRQGRTGAPAVYAKVSSFVDWIQDTMSKY